MVNTALAAQSEVDKNHENIPYLKTLCDPFFFKENETHPANPRSKPSALAKGDAVIRYEEVRQKKNKKRLEIGDQNGSGRIGSADPQIEKRNLEEEEEEDHKEQDEPGSGAREKTALLPWPRQRSPQRRSRT